jgi:hypothetical protein
MVNSLDFRVNKSINGVNYTFLMVEHGKYIKYNPNFEVQVSITIFLDKSCTVKKQMPIRPLS